MKKGLYEQIVMAQRMSLDWTHTG